MTGQPLYKGQKIGGIGKPDYDYTSDFMTTSAQIKKRKAARNTKNKQFSMVPADSNSPLSSSSMIGNTGQLGDSGLSPNGLGGSLDLGDGGAGGGFMKGFMEKGQFGLDVIDVGVGVANAVGQLKMNKFLREYYGEQVALQKADFQNMARSTNEALRGRKERQLDSSGTIAGTDASKKELNKHMDKWGVDETFNA